jgi:hypothetical protein
MAIEKPSMQSLIQLDDIPERTKVWMAAAIEYEGSFSILKQRYETQTLGVRYKYAASLQISNTRRELLDKEELAFWGGKICPKKTTGKRKKQLIRYYYGGKLIRLIDAVMPYLVTKRGQAALCLELVQYKKAKCKPSSRWEEIYQEMRKLNERGNVEPKEEAG